MTARTKRRLAVLALALGLIAAAPQVFYAVVAWRPMIVEPNIRFKFEARPANDHVVVVRSEIFSAEYISWAEESILFLRGPRGSWQFALPGESITLRVACAVALAGVWALVVCGRWLARRWRQPETTEPTVS